MGGAPGGDGVFVHPAAICESTSVGSGTRVWAFAHVLAGAVVGADCNICGGAFVEGGVRLGRNVTVKNGVMLFSGVSVGDDVFLGPNCVFTNDLRPRAAVKKRPEDLMPTEVADGATIGANATVVCGTRIGRHSFVAAGAVVAADVPDHALVAGNPARVAGWVCSCGERLDASLTCTCGRSWTRSGAGLVPAPVPPPVGATAAGEGDGRR